MNFKQLFDDYHRGKLDDGQRMVFEKLLHDPANRPLLENLIDTSLRAADSVEANEVKDRLYKKILEQYIDSENDTQTKNRLITKIVNWQLFAGYAAAVVVVLGVAGYFWFGGISDIQNTVGKNRVLPADVPPGSEGAVLTLANGRQVVLDSMGNGWVADENGSKVLLKNGALHYEQTTEAGSIAGSNTMTTPRGRQFQLSLPDGSKVWLNAASSISYPTAFAARERIVELTGEAYFEIVNRPKQPFKVKLRQNMCVEVLGTSFNVDAYNEEPLVKTSLMAGKVAVVLNNDRKMLAPGEQAQFSQAKAIQVVKGIDMEQVLAWKNGLFNFNNYTIKSMMQELGRWYDLEIVYEGEPGGGEVMGEVQRNLSLAQVMKVLDKIQVRYRLEGKKMIVMK